MLHNLSCIPHCCSNWIFFGRCHMTDFHEESPTFIDGSIAPSEGARADMTRTPGTCNAGSIPPDRHLGVEVPVRNSTNKKRGVKNGKETVFFNVRDLWEIFQSLNGIYIPLWLESGWWRIKDLRYTSGLWTLAELAFVLAVDHFFSWFAGRLVQKCLYRCWHLKMLLHEKKKSLLGMVVKPCPELGLGLGGSKLPPKETADWNSC